MAATARNQRSISGAGSLPVQPIDSMLNIGITTPLAIAVPLASNRGGTPLTFKNLASSTALATLSPTSPDTFDTYTSIPLAPGQGITLVPANDGINSGYAIE